MPVTSGISIFLNRDNYNSQIQKHGLMAIRKASIKCTCVDLNGQPDPVCRLCGGFGFIYYADHSYTDEDQVLYNEIPTNKFDVKKKGFNGQITSVERLYDSLNNTYTVKDFYGATIISDQVVNSNTWFKAKYTYTIKKNAAVTGIYRGAGVIEVPQGNSIDSYVSRFDKHVQPEILTATYINNITKSKAGKFVMAYRNFVVIEDDPTFAVGDQFTLTVTYVPPELMLFVGVTQKMRYEQPYLLESANLTVTVPNNMLIGDGDIFVMAVGEQTHSTVKTFIDNGELPHYDVSRILLVMDEKGRTYTEGVDFFRVGRARIRFKTIPSDSFKYTIKYTFHPTFTAFGINDMPMLRYGENQDFPRRVMLQNFNKLSMMGAPIANVS
jgi:hypothetical protein